MNYYCIACKVSKEIKVKEEIILLLKRTFSENTVFKVLFPTKQYRVKKGKTNVEVCKALTPGYLFIKTEAVLDKYSREFKKINESSCKNHTYIELDKNIGRAKICAGTCHLLPANFLLICASK